MLRNRLASSSSALRSIIRHNITTIRNRKYADAVQPSTAPTASTSTTASMTFIPPASPIIKTPPPPRRGGYIRGSLMGFLVGTTLTGLACYVFLLDEYRSSTNSLLSSVENVQVSVAKVRDYTKKIENVEKDLKTHKLIAATKDDLELLRNELLKVIDDVYVSHLETKTQIWELTQTVAGKSASGPKPAASSTSTTPSPSPSAL